VVAEIVRWMRTGRDGFTSPNRELDAFRGSTSREELSRVNEPRPATTGDRAVAWSRP
jgi:hypothetical protein